MSDRPADATRVPLTTVTDQITEAQIEDLVALFYHRIRAHPGLGPVFGRAIDDWDTHEAKIAAFWKKAILKQPGYDGNPVQVHMANGDIRPGMFPVWLDLFGQTAREVLPAPAAAHIHAVAKRIGASMAASIVLKDQPRGAPPILR